MSNEKGFTLTELMILIMIIATIVIVILGVIFAGSFLSDAYEDHKRANCMEATETDTEFNKCMGD